MTSTRKTDAPDRLQPSAQAGAASPGPTAARRTFGFAFDDRLEAMVAGMKSRGAQLAEQAVYGLSRRGLANTSFEYAVAGKGRATFQYGAEINHGFFGVIHHLSVASASPEFIAAHPQLFVDGEARTDLVIKSPHDLPLPMLPKFDPVRALRAEIKDAAMFAAALADSPIKGCTILLADDGPTPFAIKPFVTLKPIDKLAAAQDCKLTPQQVASMRRDIFDKAVRVYDSSGIGLDVKPQNAAYDAATDTWGMYECTRLPKGHESYFVKGGFDAYIRLVESTMRKLAAEKR